MKTTREQRTVKRPRSREYALWFNNTQDLKAVGGTLGLDERDELFKVMWLLCQQDRLGAEQIFRYCTTKGRLRGG